MLQAPEDILESYVLGQRQLQTLERIRSMSELAPFVNSGMQVNTARKRLKTKGRHI